MATGPWTKIVQSTNAWTKLESLSWGFWFAMPWFDSGWFTPVSWPKSDLDTGLWADRTFVEHHWSPKAQLTSTWTKTLT